MTDNPKTIIKSSLHFLSGTMLSRITGLVRDMIMAFYFGVHPAIAAFLVAFRLSNLLRRLFGEGSMMMGFVPHFESLRANDSKRSAFFFRDLIWSAGSILVIVIGLIEVGLFGIMTYAELSLDNILIIHMTMIMLPGLFFICFYGLFSGVLQCHQQYFLSGVAPAFFNIIWIAAILMLRNESPSVAVEYLSYAILVAFFVQWAVLIPSCYRRLKDSLRLKDWFRGKLFSSDVCKMLRLLSLAVIGVGAVQINSALDVVFARCASLEGPAYLTYAIRLYQLPLSLFAIAVSSALLPPLSRSIESGDHKKYKELLSFALNRTLLLLLPCTVALYLFGGYAVSMIFGRGEFGVEAINYTTYCLWGYGIGLIPAAYVILLAPAFYAMKDYKTPMISSLLAVSVNIVLNSILVFVAGWGAVSVAVATSFAAIINLIYLMAVLRKRVGGFISVRSMESI